MSASTNPQASESTNPPVDIHRNRTLKFLTANVCGFKSDQKMELSIAALRRSNIFAATIQETWRAGTERLSLHEYTLILHGPQTQHQRGSKGVGIILSPDGVTAWNRTSCTMYDDLGPRILAIRLQVDTPSDPNPMDIFLIAAYAPVSNADPVAWDEYYDNLEICINRSKPSDLLIIGADCNASLGIASGTPLNSIGHYGLPHQNESGKRLLSFLQRNNLAAITTFFKKKPHRYTTWISNFDNHPFQIDHIITMINQRGFFKDAGTGYPICNSDHIPVICSTKFQPRINNSESTRVPSHRTKMSKLDLSPLDNTQLKNNFCNLVKENLADQNNPISYTQLEQAVSTVAKDCFVKKTRPRADWFYESKASIIPAIKNRNICTKRYFKNRSPANKRMLRLAQKNAKQIVNEARNKWFMKVAQSVNTGALHVSVNKAGWDVI